MKVLYVGKDPAMISRLRLDPNIDIEIKRDEIDALRFLQDHHTVELICTEYGLPIKDGLNFLKKVKSKRSTKHIPCILLQKKYDVKVLKRAFDKGVEDYYTLEAHSYDRILERMESLTQTHMKSNERAISSNNSSYKLPWSKRLFDIVAASCLLLMLSPILLMTMIAIRLESKGKVYYTAKRVGRKTFDFYKFRSMRVGADKMLKQLAKQNNQYAKAKPKQQQEDLVLCTKCAGLPEGTYCSSIVYDGEKEVCEHRYLLNKKMKEKESSSFIKIVDDPRITKVGKIIRNTSIDELPQLINVIKGDMSLVGNRPLPVYEAETLTKDQLSKRFLAPAGITGLWQVELRGKGGDMSEEERIELDNKYADYFTSNSYSFWFDIKILLRTVPALFQQSTV